MAVEPGGRRWRHGLILGGVLAAALTLVGLAAAANPNERDVKPAPNVQDPDEIYDKDGNPKADSKIWVLDFKFKDPRLIKVDVPGRGQKVCWYLWYQVINRTAEPHTFIPDFELVTHDRHTVHHDQVLPKVQEAIRQIEDPTGYLNIKNSVTIAAEPIPPSRRTPTPRPSPASPSGTTWTPTRITTAFSSPACPTAGRRPTTRFRPTRSRSSAEKLCNWISNGWAIAIT